MKWILDIMLMLFGLLLLQFTQVTSYIFFNRINSFSQLGMEIFTREAI